MSSPESWRLNRLMSSIFSVSSATAKMTPDSRLLYATFNTYKYYLFLTVGRLKVHVGSLVGMFFH